MRQQLELRSKMASLPHADLIHQAASSAMRLAKLQSKLRLTRQALKRSEAKRQRLVEALNAPPQTDAEFDIERRGKTQKLLSSRGVISLGIRRSLSNCSATDLGRVLLTDLHRHVVVRSEVIAAAALAICIRARVADLCLLEGGFDVCRLLSWQNSSVGQTTQLSQQQQPQPSSMHPSLTCIYFRSDATNSSIWQQHKLQNLQATMLQLIGKRANALHGSDPLRAFSRVEALREPQQFETDVKD